MTDTDPITCDVIHVQPQPDAAIAAMATDPLAAVLHVSVCPMTHQLDEPDEADWQCVRLAARLRDAGVTLVAPPSDPAAPLDVKAAAEARPATDAGKRLLWQIYESPLRLSEDALVYGWASWIVAIERQARAAALLDVERLANPQGGRP